MSRKETILATRERRKHQDCKTYELKFVSSKFSKATHKYLHQLFLEAKWLYNYILSTDDVFKFNTKVQYVPVVTPDKVEERKLEHISSQMKQGIQKRIFNSIKALSVLKKNKRVGKLKFKSRISSVPLTQHKYTHTIDRKHSCVKIQRLKQRLKVRGIKQLPEDCEIASGNLIKRDNEYYLHITVYTSKKRTIVPNTIVGIDAGCSTQLTLSNGIKIEYQVPVSKRLKRLDRNIMKKNRSRSHNKYKDQVKRRKEYRKLGNIKQDIKNKIVHSLRTQYKYVCFQDENLSGWQAGGHGKKIQTTAIGGIMSALKLKAHTPIEVSRFFPSTQLCPCCGTKYKLERGERTYSCICGYSEDRDIKAAICIKQEALKQIPVERRNFKPEEIETSMLNIRNSLSRIPHVRCKFLSLSQETSTFK